MRLLLILILFFTLSYADRDGGPYLGFGYGISKYNNDGLYDNIKKDTINSATFYAGAYINKHLSVEFSYVSFDTWHHNKGYEVSDAKSLNFGVLGISTLAHYAFFNDVLDFYARFGACDMSLGNVKDHGFAYLTGGGVGLRLNKYVAFKVAYDLYSFDVDMNSDGVHDKSMSIDYIYTAIEVQF